MIGLAGALLIASLAAAGEDVLVVEVGHPTTIAIRRGDPALGTHGPSRRVWCNAEFGGLLHVFALAPGRDPFLRVEFAAGAAAVEDDDTGGDKTPYLDHAVEPGDEITFDIAVDVPPDAESVDVELHVESSPETDATRDAADVALRRLRELSASPPATRADLQDGMRVIVDDLTQVDGAAASPRTTAALTRIGEEAFRNGIWAIARDAWSVSLALAERIWPPDDPRANALRGDLGAAFEETGDLERAAELKTRAFTSASRTLADDDPALQVIRVQRAALLVKQFRDDEAVTTLRTAIGYLAQRGPPDNDTLGKARSLLGLVLSRCGDVAGAKAEYEALIATAGLDASTVLRARIALGKVLRDSGEVQAGRALLESALDECERTLPEDHPVLDEALSELASTLSVLGDYPAAMALFDRRVKAFERHPPSDPSVLQSARLNLAVTYMMVGEREHARSIQQQVVDELETAQPVDERELIYAVATLATTLSAMGRLEEAVPMLRRVDEAWSRWFEPNNERLLSLRLNFALALQKTGALDEAKDVARDVLDRRELVLPLGDPTLQRTYNVNLLGAARRRDHTEGTPIAERCAANAVRGIADALLVMSPREVEQVARQRATALDALLAYARTVDDPKQRQQVHAIAWPAIETTRSAAETSTRLARQIATAIDADAASALKQAIVSARQEVARCAGAGDALAIVAAARSLEASERALREKCSGQLRFEPPTLPAIAAALPADAAVVSYWAYFDEVESKTARMLALVMRRDGQPIGVELGPRSELIAAVEFWRAAIQLDGGRGTARATSGASTDATPPGVALRQLAFDPLRTAIGDARHLILLPDDALNLVPFDALPDGGGCLGDRFKIERCTSLTDRTEPSESPHPSAPTDVLVLAGGIDFGSADGADAFTALPETAAEIDAIARLRRDTSGADAAIETLAGRDATKARLLELAPRARYLHLATHGEFDAAAKARDAASNTVTGFAPLLLCDIALAGANDPPDAEGRRNGILTGDEIASLDLSGCELAVLSACETSIGERHPGQGIASLQTALRTAGARTTITSLWRVPDEPTRTLMVEFYRRVWVEKQPKARALWDAKRMLRDRGAPVADWAAWVMTGEAE